MDHPSGEEKSCVYVTFTKEYLIRGGSCVRLRDRGTGAWEPVLPNRVIGSVPRGEADPEFVNEVALPRVGERLCLLVGGLRVVSTPVLAIEWPAGVGQGRSHLPVPRAYRTEYSPAGAARPCETSENVEVSSARPEP